MKEFNKKIRRSLYWISPGSYIKNYLPKTYTGKHGKCRNLIILSLPRCGSTLLQESLNSHPSISLLYEPFNHENVIIEKHENNPALTYAREKNPQLFCSTILDLSKKSSFRYAGFKFIIDEHVSKSIFKYLISKPEITIIHLIRNPIESTLSYKKAKKSGEWHISNLGLDRDKITPLRIEPSELEETIRQQQFLKDELMDLDKSSVIEVFYDDLLNDLQMAIDDIFDKLNLKSVRSFPKTKKISQNPVFVDIQNYYELKEKYSETKTLEHFKY